MDLKKDGGTEYIHQLLTPGQTLVASGDYVATGKKFPSGETDISVKKYDRMKLVNTLPSGWFLVDLNGKIGAAPAAFVAIEDKSNWVEAIWSYNSTGFTMSTGDRDISFSKGERMLVLEQCPNEWIKVKSKKTTEIGVVPKSYVKTVAQYIATTSLFTATASQPPSQGTLKIGSMGPSQSETSAKAALAKDKTNEKEIRKSSSASNLHHAHVEKLVAEEHAERKNSGASRMKAMKLLGLSPADVLSDRRDSRVEDEKLSKPIVFPSNYAFAAPDSDSNILYLTVDSSTTKLIKAATPVKIVERLTHPNLADASLVFDFLLTFRSFMTQKQFLELLERRWEVPIPVDIANDQNDLEIFERTFVKPVRLRVFNVVKKWVDDHYYDFEENPNLLTDLNTFVEKMKLDLEAPAENLKKNMARKTEKKIRQSIVVHNTNVPQPYPIEMKLLSSTDSTLSWKAFHPEEVARQMTLIESNLFRSILPPEFIGGNWGKPDKQHKSQNILAMIQRFNNASSWVAATIVGVEKTKDRIECLTYFLEIAQYLREMQNFNGVMELLAGLRNSAVHRLKKTWAGIPNKYLKSFDELVELMSPSLNYSKLRGALRTLSPPCVPYLGVFLTDLTFMNDGNPDEIKNLVNFDKRRRVAGTIREIQQYQNAPYHYAEVPIIQGYLLASGEFVDENKCYEISLIREPRAGEPGSRDSKYGDDEGTNWRKSAAIKRKDELNKKSEHSVYSISSSTSVLGGSGTSKSAYASTTPSSPSGKAPKELPPMSSSTSFLKPPPNATHDTIFGVLSQILKDNGLTIDDLVDCVMEGNSLAVEKFLEKMTAPEAEKERIRTEIVRLVDVKMSEKYGAVRVDSHSSEDDEESMAELEKLKFYDKLLACLAKDDKKTFEMLIASGAKNIYEIEKIRRTAEKMFNEQKKGGSK